MGLQDLLKDPSLYKVGEEGVRIPTINFTSKGLDYPEDKYGLSQGPLLGRRVSFDTTDELANHTFEHSYDHSNFGVGDSFIRGGLANPGRLLTDTERIGRFLITPNGIQFIAKQVALQAQNPRPQKIYNLGVNTLASVATAGVSNVRRGGLLPTIGGFNILGKDVGTYIGEVGLGGRSELRENKYGLGDPGYKTSKNLLEDIASAFGGGGKLEYNVYLDQKIDKVNYLPIFESSDSIPNIFEQQSKDFVPFRFEVINQDGGNNNIIVFRAFLDNISDDYSATHNSYKYNGRGEEFYTYNKFNRKIQVSFKVAAQSRHEMQPIYQKLNYLAAQTAPNYSSSGRIRTPYTKLTVGHWFNKIPGLITSVGLSWQKDYPWEIALDREVKRDKNGVVLDTTGKDVNMLILPHVLDVNLSFQPIHNFTPSNDIMSPFIGINGDASFPDWTGPAFNTRIEGDTESADMTYEESEALSGGEALPAGLS